MANNKTLQLIFAFVDETGIGPAKDQPYFGVGVLFAYNLMTMVRDLHTVFTRALKHFRAKKDRLEFKFNNIYRTNFEFHEEFVRVLGRYQDHWTFVALFEDKKKVGKGLVWEKYLVSLREILQGRSQEVVVISDFLSKPHASKADFNSRVALRSWDLAA